MIKNSETFFDGEKYISSKQAALLANYTSDYIGQLCRGEKIKSKRIGRDWFVSESNLIAYQNKLGEKQTEENELNPISRQSRLSDANTQIHSNDTDIYSFDISNDQNDQKKDFHLKELYRPKISDADGQKIKIKSNSRESRNDEIKSEAQNTKFEAISTVFIIQH